MSRVFDWIDELFGEFEKSGDYKLKIQQKRFIAKGLGLLILLGVVLGIVMGLLVYGWPFSK